MRRRLHLFTTIGSLLVIAATATAASSVAPVGHAALIICPGHGTAFSSCCGPPVNAPDHIQPSLCCPVIADCAISLTISSIPDPSTAGKSVEITGRLAGAPAGTTVALWQRLAGQSGFKRVAQTVTHTLGQYVIVRARGVVQSTRQFYVTSGSTRSATVDQQVHASLTLSPSAKGAGRGARVVLKGLVTPSHTRERVSLEQRLNGAWRVIARPRLTRSSRYSVAHRFMHKGVVELRAVLLADQRNMRSVSPVTRIAIG